MFADIIKDLETKSTWIRVGPKSNTSTYTRKGETDTQAQRGESHMKTEAEIEVMHLQAKKHQGMPGAARSH